MDQDAYYEAAQRGPLYVPDIPRPQEYEMTSSDYFVSEVCDFLQTYTVLILSMAGSCAAVFLFYRHKLKKPISELASASQKIAENQLDFHITYENKDEMGVLCKEFETMRGQLAEKIECCGRPLKKKTAAGSDCTRYPLSFIGFKRVSGNVDCLSAKSRHGFRTGDGNAF